MHGWRQILEVVEGIWPAVRSDVEGVLERDHPRVAGLEGDGGRSPLPHAFIEARSDPVYGLMGGLKWGQFHVPWNTPNSGF